MAVKKRNLLKLATAVVASCLLAHGAAHAVPLTNTARAMDFTGTVSYFMNTSNSLNGNISVGTSVVGRYIVDPTAIDQNPDTSVGVYSWDWSGASLPGFMVNVGGNIFVADNATVTINNGDANSGYDRYYAYGGSTTGDELLNMSLSMYDSTGTAFSSDEFVLEPDLGSFQSTGFSISTVNISSGQWTMSILITSTIQSLVDPPLGAPEPSGSLLVGLGLIGIGLARRRRFRI